MSLSLDNPIEKYADLHCSALSPQCEELADYTRANVPVSQMLIGKSVGTFLQTLIYAFDIQCILEIGTYTGFSALCMAEALPTHGSITTIDIDPKNQALAKSFWEKSPHGKKIRPLLGPALEHLPILQKEARQFDLVFIDADKQNNPHYFRQVLPMLSAKKGLIVIDNSFLGGRVMNVGDSTSARIVDELNTELARQNHLSCSLLTVRDGLMLIAPKRHVELV